MWSRSSFLCMSQQFERGFSVFIFKYNFNSQKPLYLLFMSEERCTKGWTWGVYKIENSHLVLQMDSKIGFKVRFGDLLNASLPTKNELALELQDSPNETT